MPLLGVTEELVQAAVKQLEREGRPIGLKTLRAHLGRGSYSTLKKHLDRVAPRLDEKRRVPAPTHAAQAELDAVVRRVWSTAYGEASQAEARAFAAKAVELEAQRSRLTREALAIREEARRLERRVARLEAELRSMGRRLAPRAAAARDGQPDGAARADGYEVSR